MYEYKVVPAPVKGLKAKGVKTAEARFALAVEQAINDLAADGWDYVRTDVLPSEERQGLTGSVTHWRNLMMFRRTVVSDAVVEPVAPERVEPVLTAAPVVAAELPDAESVTAADVSEPAFEVEAEKTRPA